MPDSTSSIRAPIPWDQSTEPQDQIFARINETVIESGNDISDEPSMRRPRIETGLYWDQISGSLLDKLNVTVNESVTAWTRNEKRQEAFHVINPYIRYFTQGSTSQEAGRGSFASQPDASGQYRATFIARPTPGQSNGGPTGAGSFAQPDATSLHPDTWDTTVGPGPDWLKASARTVIDLAAKTDAAFSTLIKEFDGAIEPWKRNQGGDGKVYLTTKELTKKANGNVGLIRATEAYAQLLGAYKGARDLYSLQRNEYEKSVQPPFDLPPSIR